ncbi:unnamed protein product [Lepidochelys olivacea]
MKRRETVSVGGKKVTAWRDTGAQVSAIHASLVEPNLINPEIQVTIQPFKSNSFDLPIAKLPVQYQGWSGMWTFAVYDDYPIPMLLGKYLANHVKWAKRVGMVTRSQAKQAVRPSSVLETSNRTRIGPQSNEELMSPASREQFQTKQEADESLQRAWTVARSNPLPLSSSNRSSARESIISGACSEKCTCLASGGLVCEPHSCPEKEICALQDGVCGCVKQEGRCTLLPGAWLTSFDGASGGDLHSGAYELASLCNDSAPSWFRVVVDVRACSDGAVMAGTTTYIFFRDAFITVKRNKETWVNGRPVPLLAKISDAVSVREPQSGVAVVQALGMMVLFSPSEEVTVRVSKSLANKLCASCGNFNGEVFDDLRLLSAGVAGNITEVIDAWKARDFSGCHI